jgi:hypothetical protein
VEVPTPSAPTPASRTTRSVALTSCLTVTIAPRPPVHVWGETFFFARSSPSAGLDVKKPSRYRSALTAGAGHREDRAGMQRRFVRRRAYAAPRGR